MSTELPSPWPKLPSLWGVLWGALCVCLTLGTVSWLLLPSFLTHCDRPPDPEALAIDSLKALRDAQTMFRDGGAEGEATCAYAPSLPHLGQAGLIDEVLALGLKQGYSFTLGVGAKPELEWWAKASPTVPGTTGDRYFYADQSGRSWFSTSDRSFSSALDRSTMSAELRVLGE